MKKQLLFLIPCLMLGACVAEPPHHHNDKHPVGYTQPAPKQPKHNVAPKHQEKPVVRDNRKGQPKETKKMPKEDKRDQGPSKDNNPQPKERR